MRYFHPFEPIIFDDSKVLILGSFPSIKSFEDNFYYAHPKNQFWKILSDIFKMPSNTKEERIELLKKHHIALWDVIKSCERKNSLDSNLKNPEVNDFNEFLKKYPNIKAIFFTGRKAEGLFKRFYKDIKKLPLELLPSPSPAYAVMPFEEKKRKYEEIFKKYSLL